MYDDCQHLHRTCETCARTRVRRLVQVARTLLSFGAKPELRDSLDRSAKDLAAGDTDLGLMLALFEDDGPAAFEDPPGTWLAHADPNTGALRILGR